MIPINSEQNVIHSTLGGQDEIKYRISSNRTIFEILRSSIYTDPIGSCVREICCNARDSMRRKGNADRPIQITLNNSYFVVKDEGTGMSPEIIREVYSVLGETTKSNDNIEQGMMGLGAKSAFAVSDTYSIETVWDSTKYFYLASMNESGSGAIKLIKSEPTDECGTTIKVPIGDKKSLFKSAIDRYTSLWDVPPKILGQTELPPLRVKMEGSCWRVYNSPLTIRNFNILLDGIPYRSDIPDLPDGVILVLKIGDLEFTASRENLRSCEWNEKKIKESFEIYATEISQILHDKVKNEPDPDKAMETIREYTRFIIHKTDLEWAGKKFVYPFDDKLYLYKRLQHKKSLSRTAWVTLTTPKVHFISGPSTLNRGQKAKLSYYQRAHDFVQVCIVPKDFVFPTACDIDDIKIIRGKRNPIPTHIPVRIKNKQKRENRAIDSDTVYTMDDINMLAKPHLIGSLVQIEEGQLGKVKKYTKWKSLEEVIDEYGGKDDLHKIGESLYYEDLLGNLKFLKDYISYPEIGDALSANTSDLDEHKANVARFVFKNGKSHTIEKHNLFGKYPLLNMLSPYCGFYGSEQSAAIKYVEMINQELKGEEV